MLGTQIDGRYRIDALIARGGMSTVYRALDTRLDRPVAIKIMDPKFAVDPQFVARFEFEARAVARLSHPGLVAVYDHGRDGEFAFLVMELVEGGTLRELLRERGPMPPHAALAVIQPVLDALAVAHRAGLVHRDIKPENILISDSGDVKIADFGLVRAVAASTTTSSSVILGTAAYLSPEQVTVGTADAASDVFSVGVVLFELLTGRTPFTGDTSLSIAYQRIDNDVPAPSRFIVGVPPPLDELVRHATARSASDRFPNADVMGKAVRNVSSQLQLPDYRVPSPRRSAEHLSAAVMGAPTAVGDPRSAGPATPSTRTRAFSAASPPNGVADTRGPGDHHTRVVTAATSLPEDAAAIAGPPPAVRGVYQFPDFAADRKKSRRTLVIWVAIVAIVAVALGIGGWWIGDGRYTSVPSIDGMDTASADATIQAAGLAVDSRESYSNDVAFRSVIGTDPPAGSRVTKDSHVSLLVSLGRPAVPPIETATSASSMQQTLRDLTLMPVDGGSAFSTSVPAGDVVGLSPTPGTVVDVASQVKVVVSKGAPPVTIPDLTGKSEDEARGALEALGITAGETQKIFDASVDGGDVVSTDPAAGVTVTAGGTATLSVSTAVTVPSLLGKSVRSAKEQLAQLGLDATVSQVFDTDGSLVISQNPRSGTRVEPGSTVSVISLP